MPCPLTDGTLIPRTSWLGSGDPRSQLASRKGGRPVFGSLVLTNPACHMMSGRCQDQNRSRLRHSLVSKWGLGDSVGSLELLRKAWIQVDSRMQT